MIASSTHSELVHFFQSPDQSTTRGGDGGAVDAGMLRWSGGV